MVFHHLSKRKPAVGLECSLPGLVLGLESPLLGLMWLLLAPS